MVDNISRIIALAESFRTWSQATGHAELFDLIRVDVSSNVSLKLLFKPLFINLHMHSVQIHTPQHIEVTGKSYCDFSENQHMTEKPDSSLLQCLVDLNESLSQQMACSKNPIEFKRILDLIFEKFAFMETTGSDNVIVVVEGEPKNDSAAASSCTRGGSPALPSAADGAPLVDAPAGSMSSLHHSNGRAPSFAVDSSHHSSAATRLLDLFVDATTTGRDKTSCPSLSSAVKEGSDNSVVAVPAEASSSSGVGNFNTPAVVSNATHASTTTESHAKRVRTSKFTDRARAALCEQCGLKMQDFDPKYDYHYKTHRHSLRGDVDYHVPPKGSYKLGLEVAKKFGDANWLAKDSDWAVVFHGTSATVQAIAGIVQSGFKIRGGSSRARHGEKFGEGIYCSPWHHKAMMYAHTPLLIEDKPYSVLFQCRVRKGSYEEVASEEWVVQDHTAIRPCGILLLRFFLEDDAKIIYDETNPYSKKDPKWQEYERYKKAATVREAKNMNRSLRMLQKDLVNGRLTLPEQHQALHPILQHKEEIRKGLRLKPSKSLQASNTHIEFLPKYMRRCTVLVKTGRRRFRVTNEFLGSSSRGLSYRRSKDVDDRSDGRGKAAWGAYVTAVYEDKDWVGVNRAISNSFSSQLQDVRRRKEDRREKKKKGARGQENISQILQSDRHQHLQEILQKRKAFSGDLQSEVKRHKASDID